MRTVEQGEGKFGTIITLLIIVAVLYGAWNVGPVYFANYSLKDKMNEMARSPRGTTPDEKIYELLMKYVRDEGLGEHIKRTNFRVTTLESSRKITCEYEREVEVLPGVKHRFRFKNEADQPLVF